MQTWSAILVAGAQAYAAVGGAVALAYLCFGLDGQEPAARDSYLFRVLILPGLLLLWPLVVLRWAGLEPAGKPPHRRVHLASWLCLAVVVPSLLAIGLTLRAAPLPPTTSLEISTPRVTP